MVAGGIQPNWRHIFLGLVILVVIWYAFHGSKVNTKYIQEGILAQVIKKYIFQLVLNRPVIPGGGTPSFCQIS
jgi:hypothetical protein